MSPARTATVITLCLRVAYGGALLAAPERLARRWLGPQAGSAPTQVPLRGMGAREIVLHGGALAAALSGAPLRPWLAGSIAGDLTDLAATVVGREQLPKGSVMVTSIVAGASALLSAALAVAVPR
ncbi:MAG: hypothetical protein ACR2LV_06275 [Solirubrobacteraceae bacterium]